jgi:hypothetical protein
MTAATAPRRGSAVETWRLFTSGALEGWVCLPLSSLAALGLLPVDRADFYFWFMGMLIAAWFAGTTVFFEALAISRLAFMTLVPQPVESKWLVLVPNCVAAILLAAVVAIFGKMPAVAGLPLLGCAFWTIGAMRWLRARSIWLVPLTLAVAPVAASAAYQAGGWGAASAVALVLGLGALAFQPPVFFDTAATPSPARSLAPIAARPFGAVSRGGRERALWLKSAIRYLLVCTAGFRPIKVATFAFCAGTYLVMAVPGIGLFMLISAVPTDALKETYSCERFQFLRPIPFTRRQRFVGGLVIPLLLMIAVPESMMAYVDIDWINHDGLLGRLFRSPIHDSTLTYLRDVVGATFLPEKWPAGGLSHDLWPRLRPLLWLDLLRVVCIQLAYLFGAAHLTGGSGRALSGVTLLGFAIQMVALLGAIASLIPNRFVPVPPLWFAALLAAVAIATFAWRVRAVNAPGAATGSSTPS